MKTTHLFIGLLSPVMFHVEGSRLEILRQIEFAKTAGYAMINFTALSDQAPQDISFPLAVIYAVGIDHDWVQPPKVLASAGDDEAIDLSGLSTGTAH